MAIDWEAGRIDEDQHRLRPEQTIPLVNALTVGDIAYVDGEAALSADLAGSLWLNPGAQTHTSDEISEEDVDVCRVVCTEDGFIVDASAPSFTLAPGSKDKIDVDADRDFEAEGWFPVVGLIEDPSQHESIGKILFAQYNIVLGRSALQSGVESGSEPGDESPPA